MKDGAGEKVGALFYYTSQFTMGDCPAVMVSVTTSSFICGNVAMLWHLMSPKVQSVEREC
jgi:hypothetical protein